MQRHSARFSASTGNYTKPFRHLSSLVIRRHPHSTWQQVAASVHAVSGTPVVNPDVFDPILNGSNRYWYQYMLKANTSTDSMTLKRKDRVTIS